MGREGHRFLSLVGHRRLIARPLPHRLILTLAQIHHRDFFAQSRDLQPHRPPTLARSRPRHGAPPLDRRQQPVFQRQRRRGDMQQPIGGVTVAAPHLERLRPRRPIHRARDHKIALYIDQRVNRVAVAPRVLLALENQQTRPVRHHVAVLGHHRFERRRVDGLRPDVHRAHHRRVHVAAAERPEREFEAVQPRELLRRNDTAGAPAPVLPVEAVRHDVGHEAERRRRQRPRDDLLPRRLDPPGRHRAGPHVRQKLLQPQIQPKAAGVRIATHADKHRSAVKRHDLHLCQSLVRHLERQHLLRERVLQILGRKGRALQRQPDVAHRARGPFRRRARVTQHRPPKIAHVRPVAHPRRHRHDRAARPPRQRHPGHGLRAPRGRGLLHQQMRVVPAETKRVDRRAPHRVRFPLARFLRRHQRRARERRIHLVEMQNRRTHPVLHRLQHLDQTRHASHRQQMPEVRLERTQRHPRPTREDLRAALDLRRIADARARRMTFDQFNLGRPQTRTAIRRLHRPHLPRRRRHQQTRPAPVVRQPHAADHPEDPAAVALRILQAFEHDHGRALRRHQPVGLRMQRPAPPARAERLQRREPRVNRQSVHPRHPARHHHVGPAARQPVAGKLDRVKRRRTRRVHHESATRQLQRLAQQIRRQPGHETVEPLRRRQPRGPHARLAQPLLRPHRRRHRVERISRIRKIADDRPAPDPLPRLEPRVRQRRAPDVEQPLAERIQSLDQRPLQPVRRRVEDLLKPRHIAAAVRRNSLRRRCPRVRPHQPPLVRHLPRGRRGARQQVAPSEHGRPQLLRRVRAGQQTGLPDNRDGAESRHVVT